MGVFMVNKNEILLWKGRKCIAGLPISFTKYEMTETRLFVTRGLLNLEIDEVLLYRILDIKLNLTLGGRLLGVGTITLYCADEERILKIENIKHPRKIRELISVRVENERERAGIRGKEIIGIEARINNTSAHLSDELE
jgi:hypothetical protein